MGPENTNEPMQPIQPAPQINEERSVGPAIGIIVIIAVIVLGGLYFWGQRAEKQKAVPTPTQTETTTAGQTSDTIQFNQELQTMQTQGTTDDTSSIQADLNATNLDTLGSEAASVSAAAASVTP